MKHSARIIAFHRDDYKIELNKDIAKSRVCGESLATPADDALALDGVFDGPTR